MLSGRTAIAIAAVIPHLAPLGDPAFQGEHNRNVFGELGLSEGQIDGYIASGALVSVPIPAPVRDDAGGAEPMAKVNKAPLVTTAS